MRIVKLTLLLVCAPIIIVLAFFARCMRTTPADVEYPYDDDDPGTDVDYAELGGES